MLCRLLSFSVGQPRRAAPTIGLLVSYMMNVYNSLVSLQQFLFFLLQTTSSAAAVFTSQVHWTFFFFYILSLKKEKN